MKKISLERKIYRDKILCRGENVEVFDMYRKCNIKQIHPELYCNYLNEDEYCLNSNYELVEVITDKEYLNQKRRKKDR